MNRKTGKIFHQTFQDMVEHLTEKDLLVLNDTRVVPARLHGRKDTGGKIELLILDYVGGCKALQERGAFESDCLVKASKRPVPGSLLLFDGGLKATVTAFQDGVYRVRFDSAGKFEDTLEKIGQIPLPPYIRRNRKQDATADDRKCYQTIYAKNKGAVAAPTAGLHFTRELLERLWEKGVVTATLTLHVGYGTFVPVRVKDIRDHRMHAERYSISRQAAEAVNAARGEGRRIVAVGTTAVRTLEYASDNRGRVLPGAGACDLFIYPGYRFKSVDAMITNFHLPQSTLLMLVSAFAGRENIFSAYHEAIREKYRFFSYGDAMFIH